MANYIPLKFWEDRSLRITPENTYKQRRKIIKQLGLATGGMLLAPSALNACSVRSTQQNKAEVQKPNNDFTFPGMEDLYPAQRNSKYTVGQPPTEEYHATHYNNFYEFINPSDNNIYNVYQYVDEFDTSDWTINVSGKVKNKGNHRLEDLIKKIGLEERIYRFRCVERWAMVVPWTGFPLSKLVKFLEPNSDATHIRMVTQMNAHQMVGVRSQPWYPWPYFEGLRIDEAMNEMAFMATGIYGKPLPKQNGAPIRLVVPWKYGYKNIKSVVEIAFINRQPETFWHKLVPHEYPFISNVDPDVPHPRWSQVQEYYIPNGTARPTLKYNGYGEFVTKLYE